jgi:pimeloyl-ACP methyl ester carboxylesterase
MTVQERRVDIGEVALAVLEAGAGGRPLLLVHGFTGAKEDFGDWMDALADRGWHAVAPDLRGHGASDKPADEAAYGFEIFAGDLLGLLDALGWDDAVILGHSMGGMVVQHAVLKAPERCRALILMDTSDGPLSDLDLEIVDLGVSIVRESGIAELMRIQKELGIEVLETPASKRLLAERPGYAEFGERKMHDSSPAMYAAMAAVFGDPAVNSDRLPQLSSLRVPALVLVGEQDVPFLESSHRMAAAIPGARLEVIPDGGHSPQFESPDAWWAAMTSFLDALPAS